MESGPVVPRRRQWPTEPPAPQDTFFRKPRKQIRGTPALPPGNDRSPEVHILQVLACPCVSTGTRTPTTRRIPDA